MIKKGKTLAMLTLSVIFASIVTVNAQEPPLARNFRFPLEGDWAPLWQDFNNWKDRGYHLGEDVGREDADKQNYPVYPMGDGVVKFADIVLGYTVIIEHKLPVDDPDGDYVCSVYYHMKRPGEGGIHLTVGTTVFMDSPIGYVSGKWEDHKSSPHLHFGIRKGRYKTGKDSRTGYWYYPGYTTIKKDGEVQKNPNDPTHRQVLADWFNPTTDPKNGTGFIERHLAQAAPLITSPLKITPSPPYSVGDEINAEFTIADEGAVPITFAVLTVGGRDPDAQVADFTHTQDITLEPSESYEYKGTLTLAKAGKYHFFCAYQTPDDEWNTSIDLGAGLTDEDRIEDIIVTLNNVALGKPCTVITNGAEDYSDGHPGEWPRDITDGKLAYQPVSSDKEDGCIAWQNEDHDELLVVTVTIDLGATHNITKIRYNPGNCERAETWNADIMESPFGRTPTNPGSLYRGTWTEQTGSITTSKITIKLGKTRRSWATDWLFIGEIEVWGTSIE